MHSVFELEAQQNDPDSKIAAALERLTQAYRVLLWQQNKAHSLSPIQVQLLVFLHQHQPELATIGNLAREFTLTPATVSDAVNSLETKRLAVRQKGETDRRVISVILTAEGRRLARQLLGWADIVQQKIAALPQADKPNVLRFLLQLIDGLQREGLIAVSRMCLTCRFFEMRASQSNNSPYFCHLLEKPLATADLRIDCPEHELA